MFLESAVICQHRKEMQTETVLSGLNCLVPCSEYPFSDLGPSDWVHKLSELIPLDINDFPFFPQILNFLGQQVSMTASCYFIHKKQFPLIVDI